MFTFDDSQLDKFMIQIVSPSISLTLPLIKGSDVTGLDKDVTGDFHITVNQQNGVQSEISLTLNDRNFKCKMTGDPGAVEFNINLATPDVANLLNAVNQWRLATDFEQNLN
jgi:hypothetical protein